MKLSVRQFVKSFGPSRRPETDHAHDLLERAAEAGLIRWEPGCESRGTRAGRNSSRRFELLALEAKQ